MGHVRATLAAAMAVVLGAGYVSGQPGFPARPPQYGEVIQYKGAGPIPAATMPKAKAAFDAMAKYLADYVSNPKTHTAPQEFRPEPPPPGSPMTVDQLNAEIIRHLLVPSPVPVPNPHPPFGSFYLASGAADADYIRELGAALDKHLGDAVKQSNDRIVRVNAARMLAVACRSGAHAHYPTITDLIASPNTDPEVRYYALQGAANLLAAYDINDYRSRKHSHDAKAVGALVAAVQHCVLKAEAVLPTVAVPVGKDVRKVVAPDQVPVLQFIRRQAIKSLGQLRFAEFDVEKGKTLYPAHTLSLVALSKLPVETYQAKGDQFEPVAAGKSVGDAADAGEAVLGLLNMAPPKGGAASKQYAGPIADVVAQGVITWATPRAANPADKSLPWKGTAARLEDGLKTWQGLFDVNYDPARPVIRPDLVPAPVQGAAKAITTNVINPINAGATGAVSIQGLQTFERDVLRKGFAPKLFTDSNAPTLPQP